MQSDFSINHAKSVSSLSQLPGPNSFPVIGNLFQFERKKFHRHLEEWANKYGTCYQLKIAQTRYVVIADTIMIHELLRKRPDAFRRLSSIEEIFEEVSATGLFSAEGEAWKRQRKLTAPAFHNVHLKQFFPTLSKITGRLKGRLTKHASSQNDVEILKDFTRFTVDVTTSLAFAYDMNTLENDTDPIQEHLEKIFPTIDRRINAPFPYWRYLRLPADYSFDRSMDEVRAKVSEMIQASKRRLEEDPSLIEHPTNYLEALLASKDADGSQLSNEEIFGNVLTILVAGEDTTANSLGWFIHFLMEYPEVQKRIQMEVDQVLGENSQITEFSQLDRLPYTEAVILESMRLRSVAPVLFFEANMDTDLCGHSVVKGTKIFALMNYGATQEKYFSSPLDFKPERWLEEERPSHWNHNFKAFLPFGNGPRICPGKTLSMVEMKMVTALLCRNFWVEKPKNGKVAQEQFTFAMIPIDLWARLEVRR